jgi:hypothetical protein
MAASSPGEALDAGNRNSPSDLQASRSAGQATWWIDAHWS